METMEDINAVISELFNIHAIKFGTYTLKSGIESPVYFDLRVIVSYPRLMKKISELLLKRAADAGCQYHSVCGVPYTALPLATCVSIDCNKPMLIRRKESKDYGTKKLIEGKFEEGEICLVIEDVVTSGTSVWETYQALDSVGVVVKDAVVFLDREQGGNDHLASRGIQLHSVCGLSRVLSVLQEQGFLSDDIVERTKKFIQDNRFDIADQSSVINGDCMKKQKTKPQWIECVPLCHHSVSKQLYQIMHNKQTNLAVSADLHTCQAVLQLVEAVGPYVCMVKVHADIIEDFTSDFASQLRGLADKFHFLIFEDRKFADIGNTVKSQFSKGVHKISSWAHIINAHPLPGPGVLSALKEVGLNDKQGCLLVAEMSSSGNLISQQYIQASLKLAEENRDFVVGFICQSRLSEDPTLIHIMPGVKLSSGGDDHGQQYCSPEEAVINKGADIIIVGRGITQAEDMAFAAKTYQEAGYAAYLKTIT